MDVRTQNFFVLGISKSGLSCAEYILKNNSKCYIFDDSGDFRALKTVEELVEKGAIKCEIENIDEILRTVDVLVISPGVPINHEIAVKAKKRNIKIISEFEFGLNCLSPLVVAVTGTNGKTTTVSLIDAILKEGKIDSHLVGNIGVPMSDIICDYNQKNVLVAEVSSFQLESTNDFCPHISAVLNIAPDHLQRHFTMENYIYLKKRLIINQRSCEYCVLNFDDKVVRTFANDTKAKIVWVSLKEKVKGCYYSEGKIFYNDEEIVDCENLKLKGEHNIYNTMFAVCFAKILGVNNENIKNALCSFKGVRHRIELIGEVNGVEFYDDSKATNCASVISAIDTVTKPTALILGGSEKGEDYKNLFVKITNSNIKHVVLTGASRYNMFNVAKELNFYNVSLTEDFDLAVKMAYLKCSAGDAVLLSPACASFDSFTSYEERGERFKVVMESLK